VVGEGQLLGGAEHDGGARRALAGKAHHLLAVIESGGDRSGAQRLTQEQASSASDLEQMVARGEAEGIEDRPPREVVHVLGSVDGAGAGSGRSPRHAVDQPILEGILRKPGCPPGREVVRAETEAVERLLDAHGARRFIRQSPSPARA